MTDLPRVTDKAARRWRRLVVRSVILLVILAIGLVGILIEAFAADTQADRWRALRELAPYLWGFAGIMALLLVMALHTGKLPRSESGRADAPRAFWSYVGGLAAFTGAALAAIWLIFQGP